jgi:hypothetical protein
MATIDPFSDANHATAARKIGTEAQYKNWSDGLKKTDINAIVLSATGTTYDELAKVKGKGLTNPQRMSLIEKVKNSLFPLDLRKGIFRMNPNLGEGAGALRTGTPQERAFVLGNARTCALLQMLDPQFSGTNCLKAYMAFERAIGFSHEMQYMYLASILDGKPVCETPAGGATYFDKTGFVSPASDYFCQSGISAVADVEAYQVYINAATTALTTLQNILAPNGDSVLKGISDIHEADTRVIDAGTIDKALPKPTYMGGPEWRDLKVDGTLDDYWQDLLDKATKLATTSKSHDSYADHLRKMGSGPPAPTTEGHSGRTFGVTDGGRDGRAGGGGTKQQSCGEYELGSNGKYHVRGHPTHCLPLNANVKRDGWYNKAGTIKYKCIRDRCGLNHMAGFAFCPSKPKDHGGGGRYDSGGGGGGDRHDRARGSHRNSGGRYHRDDRNSNGGSGRDDHNSGGGGRYDHGNGGGGGKRPRTSERHHPTDTRPCRQFGKHGSCSYGNACRYTHVLTAAAVGVAVKTALADAERCVCSLAGNGHAKTTCGVWIAMQDAERRMQSQ